MKILAFAASNSRQSINQQLVSYTGQIITSLNSDINIEVIDLNDYEMPLFSVDREAELGQPEQAKSFFNKIGAADALIISFAEHNGTYTAAYKNLFDWTSRINQKVFQNKSMLLMATSPGAGGAKNVLAAAKNSASYFDGNVIADISIPQFNDNFDTQTKQITNPELAKAVETAAQNLLDSL
ncbi:NADPH-dependent FMN reductase [Aliikangiella maris]|uniref:NAD(P)H-dependent oxidoreductase n=2 Tax=Aliikangiella maris TaxID=3162458 RepID=A0ABV2BY92_9GAMM